MGQAKESLECEELEDIVWILDRLRNDFPKNAETKFVHRVMKYNSCSGMYKEDFYNCFYEKWNCEYERLVGEQYDKKI